MTLHIDENAIRAHAEAVSGKAAKKKARKWYALSAVGVLLAGGGAAWAAMAVQGDGHVAGTAYTQKPLTITEAAFSAPLAPATSVDLTMKVKNDNPFKVKLLTIGLKSNTTPTVSCTGSDAQYLSGPLGTQATSVAIPTADQTVINGGGYISQITIHNAVKLSNDASAGCALTVDFTIGGESSN